MHSTPEPAPARRRPLAHARALTSVTAVTTVTIALSCVLLSAIALADEPLALADEPHAVADEPPSSNVIEFVTHANHGRGVVRCGLFTEKGWLKNPVQPALSRVSGKKAVCVFRGIPEGTYGLSAFHDENENGKLDTNLVGMPTEDYCASRNARGTFGPPSFSDASFQYTGGTKRLEARLK